jgi:hypothetical protein
MRLGSRLSAQSSNKRNLDAIALPRQSPLICQSDYFAFAAIGRPLQSILAADYGQL